MDFTPSHRLISRLLPQPCHSMSPSAQAVPVYVSVKRREGLRVYPRCTFRGFSSLEIVRHVKHMWTGEHAEVDCFFFSLTKLKYIWLEIGGTAPQGNTVDIYVNDQILLRQKHVQGQTTVRASLPMAHVFDKLTLSIRSTTFVPRDVIVGSQDPRSLGIAVRSIVFGKRYRMYRPNASDLPPINQRLARLFEPWWTRKAA